MEVGTVEIENSQEGGKIPHFHGFVKTYRSASA